MLPFLETPVIANAFTDLGFANVSPNVTSSWATSRMEHARAAEYFNGAVFQRKVDVEVGDQANAPLLYPVALNLVKMLTLAMTNSFVGEMDDDEDAILFSPIPSIDTTDKTKKVSEYCARVVRDSKGASLLWELDFDRNLYGASVFRVRFDPTSASHIRWQKVVMDAFYPIFDPEDPDMLLECFVANYLFPEQAAEKYGYSGVSANGYVLRVEHWTRSKYEVFLDGKRIDPYSGVNPWGLIPFVYTPRLRSTNVYGDSLSQDLYSPQDELNMRIADAGEALNYNMHPVRWGINLPNSFQQKNYPVGADSMWDLGRAMNKDMRPEVGIMETKNPVPDGVFKYVTFLYDWSRTASFAPPIAFGEDQGGGQRSGVTLEIRLWPLLKALRTSRSFMSSGVSRAMKITGAILKQKNIESIPAYISTALLAGEVTPRFHRIMPRDQVAAVNEVTSLLGAATGPAISLETAQEVLGRGTSELSKIMKYYEMLQEEKLPPFAVENINSGGNQAADAAKKKVAAAKSEAKGG